jgi:hypothetical protein
MALQLSSVIFRDNLNSLAININVKLIGPVEVIFHYCSLSKEAAQAARIDNSQLTK